MQVIESVAAFRQAYDAAAKPLGLVPTMGFLHEGHMALVHRAREENATAAVSIFVNPTQFGPSEDFATYPRDMDSDLAKLEKAGVDLVFAPTVDEVYPAGFDTHVDVGCIGERLEGEHRAGHFQGVATVVCKLLTIVRPDRAYFGQKDAQQCLVVQRLNEDLNLGAEIVVCPTVRDSDGLALSSRNVYLSADERIAALSLNRSLRLAQELHSQGDTDAAHIRHRMHELITASPLADIDYISIADAKNLDELDSIDRPALVSLAVRIGKTRLIDNVII
ncbi:MAG: pantoate--beta-alanine ligase [Chloroflexi bacterium]|nr:pantoate--beta-alanine ligase [Chloroflexota bacterium]